MRVLGKLGNIATTAVFYAWDVIMEETVMRVSEPVRDYVAEQLHLTADRLSSNNARRLLHWTFTYEPGRGQVFREDGRGCRLAYLSAADYERAHTEADDPQSWVDWKTMTLRDASGPSNSKGFQNGR